MAISAIGPIAEGLGQAVGRNVGRVVGGTLGAIVPPALATAIRCPSRVRSSRSPSSVRFAPDIPFQQQHSLRNVQSGEIRQAAVENTNDLIVALRREQQDGLSATQSMVGSLIENIAQNDEKFNKLQQMMQNMADVCKPLQNRVWPRPYTEIHI